MSIAFGLDFGTSNSALSANEGGHVRLLDIDAHNPIALTLKSVLFFCREEKEKKIYAGYDAVQKYMETEGEGRYMQSIKSFLPDASFDKTEIFNKNYSLAELIAFMLKTIKTRGEAVVKQEVNDVLLGRPVVFSEDRKKDALAQQRLVEAAKIAGFKNVRFQLEPIAAALSYENRLGLNDEKIILVGDFGGGTSDFTILKASKKSQGKADRLNDILATGGVYIGGDSFDSAIMWEKVCQYYGRYVKAKSIMSDHRHGLPSLVMNKLRRWHLIPLLRSMKTMRDIKEFKYLATGADKQLIENLENLIHYNYGYLLFQAIEKSKCELSSKADSRIYFNDCDIFINEAITRPEFDGYIKGDVLGIEKCLDRLMSDAGVSPGNIDAVFLTGGSSFIPAIKKIFKKKIPSKKIIQSDAFTSVSFGLGLDCSTYF